MRKSPTDRLARFARALAAPTRLRIVALLRGRALCVNALAGQLDVTQGAVSQHLRVLRDAGIVVSEKRGYFVHYRLNDQALAVWRKEIDQLLDPKHGPSPDTKGTPQCAAARSKSKKAARNRRN